MRVFRCLAAAFAAVLWAAAAIHAAEISCDVAIIGGGPGGVHTAYKLTTQRLTPGPVCLFEMKDRLGGRVGDNFEVGFSGRPFENPPGVPVLNSGQTGTGGYRMYFNHYTYKLGQELAALGQPGQLTFLAQNSFSRLLAVQNPELNANFTEDTYFTYDNFGIAKHFAPLYNSPINNNDIWKVWS
jgi:NAD(P)-binding Rossmann-like domain